MKLVVGLGNPGPAHRDQRHNIGFRVVAAIAAQAGIPLETTRFQGRIGEGTWLGETVLLLQPETYMNRSGESVREAVLALPDVDPSGDVMIVFDDADLPLGRLRLRAKGSDGGQRGLRSVLTALERTDVPRLRFGIGRPENPMDTRAFVLTGFGPDEERVLAQAIPRAVEAVACWVDEGIGPAMSTYNAPAPEPPSST